MQKLMAALALAACLFACAAPASAQDDAVLIENKHVLQMVRAKLSPSLIVEKIKYSRCRFDTFPGVLAEMKAKGVPDEVLSAMVTYRMVAAPAAAAPAEAPAERPAPAQKPTNTGGVVYHTRDSYRPNGRRVFVAPMDEGFDGLITSQLISKKVPVVVSADESDADYIITGGTNKGVHKWYDTVITGYERDRVQGSIRLIRVSDKRVIWASDAGDRSFWWGPLKKGGQRKVAERLVNKMKDKLFGDEW